MDKDIVDDERFKKVLIDPRYKTYKEVTKNVELDKRFEKVLTDKKFRIDDDLFHKDESSSSDESSSDEEEEIDEIEDFEEEQKNCLNENLEETNRIAICNLDWDRINSNDIFILLNSFKPTEGHIKSVKIYPSEFGKERLAEELIKGPKELVELPEEPINEEKRKKISTKKFDFDEDEEFNKNGFVKNKLRKYQLNRLKYYYAVVCFDSVKTAVSIYEQLDGFEYLNSSIRLDLRFIPDDMEFEDECRDECTALPDLNFYKAPEFINTALQQTKVRLTWEEDNHDLSKKLLKSFEDIEKNKDIDYLDEYLASDTESELDSISEGYESDDNNDKVEKYRNLLKNIEEEENKINKDKNKFDIEINWGPELDNMKQDSSSEEEFDEEAKLAKLKQEKRNKFRKSKKYKKQNSDANKKDNSDLELITMDINKDTKKHFNYENYVENSKKVNKEKKIRKEAKDEFEKKIATILNS
ncbi:hypothetical protein RND71_044011 [Anisodus tanguticus]|uniref:ESF1 RRM domain-containing protein n=1 Tax=Anisodus tanguticus TaxID=243964 RepID=A0AAE1QPG9_9SOLA|nr:hypothetical protein RND71_044011 [Anisodus tanguticus]